jgi:hypothetical protein|tara:strand:+ start:497 stop:781 length:285 start_codon:yes stop_codon:yes gene_type:complete
MAKTKEKVIDLKPKAEKITEEELKDLQLVVDQNNAVQFRIGAIETQKHELVHQHSNIQKRISQIQSQFSEKYGTFDVSLVDGTINYAEDGQPRN